MKTTRILSIAMTLAMGMIAGLQASVTEHQPPAPLPEFKTPEQLAKWRAEQSQKSEAAASTQEGGVFYTGKPYLAESGSYAFKYREYNPEMHRWTTVDPSGFPDGANNYLHVNNCYGSIDDNGLQIITFVYSTFIETANISYLGRTFNGGQKTWQSVSVDTDARNISAQSKGTGVTLEYDQAGGSVIGTAQASGSTITASVLGGGSDCNFTVRMYGNENNPLVAASPGITYQVDLNFNLKTGTLNWSGSHDSFPSHQFWIDDNSVHKFSHITAGTTPTALLPYYPDTTFNGKMSISKICE